MPIDTTKTGAAIAACRQHMKLSQQGLASLMNVTHQAVSKWENGLALPDTETLLALAKLFATSMEDLLMGVLPQESEVQAEEKPADETSSSIPADEYENLDFSSVMNMLPFVSTKVADQLFRTCAKSNQLDASALLSIAPFVSTGAISEFVSAHPFKDSSPEVVASLAPFLSTKAVDDMILGMDTPLPPHVIQTLMPFANTKVADQMVLGKLGKQAYSGPDQPSDFSAQLQNRVHAKIQQKLNVPEERKPSAKRESPRMRLIRKAVETGDASLLDMMCESVDEMDATTQTGLIELLLNGKHYGKLAEVMEWLDEEMQHSLLDKAFEINDPELLQLIGEHIE